MGGLAARPQREKGGRRREGEDDLYLATGETAHHSGGMKTLPGRNCPHEALRTPSTVTEVEKSVGGRKTTALMQELLGARRRAQGRKV